MNEKRMFDDDFINDLLLNFDTEGIYGNFSLDITDNTRLEVYFGNAGFDVQVSTYCDNGYELDWILNSSVTVIGTGDFKDDLLYGIRKALERTEMNN